MNSDVFSERLWNFAAEIGALLDRLPDTRLARHVAGQLVRCGTSPAPNYDEACAAESRADFAHKLAIATKEMRETRGWLRFIVKTRMQPQAKMTCLLDEAEQLLKMLTKSLLTVKNRRTSHPQSTI